MQRRALVQVAGAQGILDLCPGEFVALGAEHRGAKLGVWILTQVANWIRVPRPQSRRYPFRGGALNSGSKRERLDR